MPSVVLDTVQSHLRLEAEIGGYEAAEASATAISGVYATVAGLVGGSPRNIAMTENATASFSQALSAIPFQPGDLILTTRNDYASNQIQFLSLQKRFGIRILHAPEDELGGVDVKVMQEMIADECPRLVSVTHIPTNSGLVQDVAAIGEACRENGVLYLVDACQSVGQMPIDVKEIGCDFLSASSRKFLRGPRGSGFLFVSDRVLDTGYEPLFIDMRGADWSEPSEYKPASDATRFENWEFAWALVLGTGAAADYALSIGLDAIEQRVFGLAARLREQLGMIRGVRVLDHGERLSGIVSLAIEGLSAKQVVTEMAKHQVTVSAQIRPYALLDYDAKGVDQSVRMAPHYITTEAEVDQAVQALHSVIHR